MSARVLSALLALAVLVAGGVLAWLVMEDDESGLPRGNTPGAPGAAVTSVTTKQAALEAAERATSRVLSYSHRSLDADTAASRDLLAGEMLEQYDDTMERIAPEAIRTGREVRATVVGSAIISATEDDAKALLFVDTETRTQDQRRPNVELTRVVVTLHHADSWRVVELDSL